MKLYANKHTIGLLIDSDGSVKEGIPTGTVFVISCITHMGYQLKPVDDSLLDGINIHMLCVTPEMLKDAFTESDYSTVK